jgi:predicted acylesterase/phospholipase RssA
VPAVRTELAGKVGLALSGGGFRASLFHIGVLAHLAELDLLRHVEVLSCVSGGSILGAAYYLKLRDLLEAKPDEEIKRQDYVKLVQELEEEFLDTIQKNNFRLRMLERFIDNLQMLRDRASRTESIGRVMDREMFRANGGPSLRMNDVGIRPAGETAAFRRDDHNWRRKNKVPLLVLNATNQGTGHGWHFTPEEMGEPTTSKIDAIPALARRPYKDDAPEFWRAVTASACVPVIFEPIGLTFGTQRLNLLDGGVHDNQGSSALLDRDCTLVLVSDASGQLTRDADPSRMALAVGKRAESIEAARLREALYAGLEARKRGSLLRGVMFLHLRLGLHDDDHDDTPTDYGLTSKLQRQLSEIRTDLDVFHDVEAHGLMLSGYRMTVQQLPEQLKENTPAGPPQKANWRFQKAESKFLKPSSEIYKLLEASSAVTFKAWHVVPALRWVARVLAVIGIAALGAVVYWAWQSPMVFTLHSIVKWALGVVVLYFAQRFLRIKFPNWKREATFAIVALVGVGIASVHKHWIDKKYLEAGRL